MDVVVPFRGSRRQRDALCSRLARLSLGEEDTVVVVDNTPTRQRGESSRSAEAHAPGGEHAHAPRGEPAHAPGGEPAPHRALPFPVLPATGGLSPGYARNRGAARGQAEWLVFFDADTAPAPDLLDRYFEPLPAASTVLLAGGVIDEPVGPEAPAAARYAYLRGTLNQERSFGMGRWAFAQAANIACRRSAFQAVGGFREDIVAGEDADLSYRLRHAGGQLERREAATVFHLARPTVREMLAQAARHGAGSAWVNQRYPGAFPSRRLPGLLWWATRFAAAGALRFARTGDRDAWVRGLLEPAWELAFELGRRRSAEASTRRAGPVAAGGGASLRRR